nr:hypothetical protein [Tanacetum cinerariifolium]
MRYILVLSDASLGASDEHQEEQGEEVVSVKRTSNRKKTCTSKKKITLKTSEDANKDKKRMKNLKNIKTKAHKKKRKGKKDELVKAKLVEAEMVEGDKYASESNEEPPLCKKKLDAPSFVDVRKLTGDMLVIKGAKTTSKKAYVGDKRKKDNVEAKKENVKKKEGKKDKDKGEMMVVEKGKEVVVNEQVKCDPVNILTRMSPSHLKKVLDSLATQQANTMVVLDKGNDVPEEAVKDNEVSKEKDDVPEKEKDVEKVVELGGKKTVQEMNREKDVEKVVDQDLKKPEDVEIGKKNTEDLIKGADVCVEISKKEVSRGVLAIYKDPFKGSKSQTSIFDDQPEDSRPKT